MDVYTNILCLVPQIHIYYQGKSEAGNGYTATKSCHNVQHSLVLLCHLRKR